LDIDSTLSTSESLTDAEIFKTSDFLSETETDSVDEAIDKEEIAVVKSFIRGAQAPRIFEVHVYSFIYMNFKDTFNNSQEFLTIFFLHLIF
jgi:hypothetical protein